MTATQAATLQSLKGTTEPVFFFFKNLFSLEFQTGPYYIKFKRNIGHIWAIEVI